MNTDASIRIFFNPERRAFTLLELLIAVTIFALVLGAMNSVFFAALRLRNNTAAALDRSLPIEQAVTLIRKDLENIVPPGGTLSGQLQSTPGTNAIAGSSSPTFVTSAGIIDENSPWSELERVSYSLMDSTNRVGVRDLVRLVSHNLLGDGTELPETQRLIANVDAINFQYYDGNQWRDYWDSTTEATRLPRGIKMQIQLMASVDDTPRRSALASPPMIEIVAPMVSDGGTNDFSQTATTGSTQ